MILAVSGAVALVAAIVVTLGFTVLGWHSVVFAAGAPEDGVTTILREHYHLEDLGQVSCPDGEPMRAGHSFTCEVTIGEDIKTVTITVVDSEGRYTVSSPE